MVYKRVKMSKEDLKELTEWIICITSCAIYKDKDD
jgi:hypothetical protein